MQALFEKRQMVYRINKGGGSFVVNACSGFVLLKEECMDSKVVVATSESVVEEWMVNQGNVAGKVWSVPKMGAEQMRLRKAFKDQQNEKKALNRAVSQSIEDFKKEQQEDQERLQQVMAQSIQENEAFVEEEIKIHEAIKQSTQEFEREKKEDEAFHEILNQSEREFKEEEQELIRVLERSTLDF